MSFRRIVVALDPSSSAAALGTAVGLACTMQAELVGLFIEDSDLIDFAALPFAGEIGFPSAARRPLDVSAMERSLRAEARRIRQQLGEQLAGHPVKWTFEVVRGRTIAALAKALVERDLAVVSVRRHGARAREDIARAFETLSAPLLIVGETAHSRRMIAVIAPPNADVREVAEIVAALGPYYGRSALIVTDDVERPRWASWQRDIEALLAERDISSRLRVVASASRVEIARVVAEERPRLIVTLAKTMPLRDALLDALPLPLLILPQSTCRAQDEDE